MKKTGGPVRAITIGLMALCWLWAALAVLFLGLRWALAEGEWFLSFYREYDTQARIGISPEDCAQAMEALIDYMEGDRDTIQLTVTEYGQQVEMYNKQETDHMVDVKDIYQGFMALTYLSPIALGLIWLGARVSGEPGRAVKRSLICALAIGLCTAAALGAWVMLDFTSFWVKFHHIFFTNDLWLMDYATCRMIRICPEEIFYSIVLRMAGRAGAILLAAACAWAAIALLRSRKGRAQP